MGIAKKVDSATTLVATRRGHCVVADSATRDAVAAVGGLYRIEVNATTGPIEIGVLIDQHTTHRKVACAGIAHIDATTRPTKVANWIGIGLAISPKSYGDIIDGHIQCRRTKRIERHHFVDAVEVRGSGLNDRRGLARPGNGERTVNVQIA